MNQFFGWLGDSETVFLDFIWNVYTWLFLAPLLLLSKRLRAWVSTTTVALGAHVGGAVAHYLGKHIRHAFAAPISAYSYAHRALINDATALLRVPLGGKGRALRIDKVFVPLALEGSGRRIFHSEVLAAGSRLRISGDPGSGKSTIMKRLFRDECRRLRSRKTLWRSMLPVLIELRNVDVPETGNDDKLAEALMAYVKRALTSVQDYRMDECLNAYLRKRGLLLLLDGADEIQSSDYPRIERAIIALSEQIARDSPSSRIVLTMRSQFETRLGRELREEFPTTLMVQRFTPSDIFQFLSNWPFEDERDARVSRIYNDLADRPNLREMCTNPLVLSMYVAVDEARNLTDPRSSPAAAETRTEFYGGVVEELLVLPRESQIGRKEAPYLFRDLRYRVLGRIAYEHLSDAGTSANRISWAKAVATIREVQEMKNVGGKKAALSSTMDQKNKEAIAYLDELHINTGIIAVEQKGETLRFIHLTFCEFMAAHYLTHYVEDWVGELYGLQQQFNTLDNAATRSRLNQVIPFALGLIDRSRPVGQPKALDSMEPIVSDDVLAAIFLETKAYAHPAWIRFYGRIMQQLAELAASPDPGDIAVDVHMLTVLVNDAATHGAMTEIEGRSFEEQLVTLSRSGGVFLQKLLEGLSSYDAVAAFRVARACGLAPLDQANAFVRRGFEQPAFTLFALEEMRRDMDHRGAWVSLAIEAGLAFSSANQIFRDSDIPADLRGVFALTERQSWTRYLGYNLLGWLFDQTFYGDSVRDTAIIDALRNFPKPSRLMMLGRLARLSRSRYFAGFRAYQYIYMIAAIPLFIYIYQSMSQGTSELAVNNITEFFINDIKSIMSGDITAANFMLAIFYILFFSWMSAFCFFTLIRWLSGNVIYDIDRIFRGSSDIWDPRIMMEQRRLSNLLNPYAKVERAWFVLRREISNVRSDIF